MIGLKTMLLNHLAYIAITRLSEVAHLHTLSSSNMTSLACLMTHNAMSNASRASTSSLVSM